MEISIERVLSVTVAVFPSLPGKSEGFVGWVSSCGLRRRAAHPSTTTLNPQLSAENCARGR
eukprot:scaffold29280_cov49-Cyclotella_meneghiniana.AAC.2